MTTNIDRAAEILDARHRYDQLRGDGVIGCFDARKAAQSLADARLLMPDLPEPTRWKQNEEPEWDACDTTVLPAGYEGRVIVEDFDYQWEASAADVRNLAYALLAAAKYAEENA